MKKVEMSPVVLLGYPSSGKTSILNCWCKNTFQEFPKIQEFKSRTITINGTEVKVTLLDTPRCELYRDLCIRYARRAKGIVFVFDLTEPSSFTFLKDIYHVIVELYFNCTNPYPFLILGNKSDLKKVIPQSTIDQFKDANNISLYYEVSAKTGENISTAFHDFIKLLLETNDFKPVENSSPITHTENSNTYRNFC